MEKVMHRIYKGLVGYFTLLAIILLVQSGNTATLQFYYSNAKTSNFVETKSLHVDDMCYGDHEQEWHGDRVVYVGDGLAADIVRELFLIRGANTYVKVLEDSATVFIEADGNGNSRRIQFYDRPLMPGQYVWRISYKALHLPLGIERTDIVPILSNVFTVSRCGE